jgi:hypothetical protein
MISTLSDYLTELAVSEKASKAVDASAVVDAVIIADGDSNQPATTAGSQEGASPRASN